MRLVTQSDHAHLAAELLSLWVADDLPDHPRRAEILFATGEHDNGWRETDSAPPLDPDGQPWNFVALPERLRVEIWRRGVERIASRPIAALLVLTHAIAIHEPAGASGEILELLEWLRARRDELLLEADVPVATIAADYRFLDVADAASLCACGALGRSFERRGLSGSFVDGVLRLEPFPFVGTTTFHIAARDIPARRYAGAADLARELGTARWFRVPIKVAPANASSG